MKSITLFAQLSVVPFQAENDKGEIEEGKQLIFTDMEGGEQTFFPMTKDYAEEIGRKLKMSNVSLKASIEEEQRRAKAQAMLTGGMPQNGVSPGEQEAVQNLLKGVHRKDEGDG